MIESLFPDAEVIISKKSESFLSNKISLFIPGVPQPKQSVRSTYIPGDSADVINQKKITGDKIKVGFVSHYQTTKVKDTERNIRSIVINQLPKGFKPFAKGINITKLHYSFPPLKSFSKKILARINSGEEINKTTKPDLTDNLNKGVFDALQGLVFINDSQICGLDNCKKFYSNMPGVSLVMEEVQETL
jgi:Holliday junction resolvase RusA-like endonuclease